MSTTPTPPFLWPDMDWRIRSEYKNEQNIPCIQDPWQSVMELIHNDTLSIARLADGELGLMTGVFTPNAGYQHFVPELQYWLMRVMCCDVKECRVALPKWFIYWSNRQPAGADRFVVREFNPNVQRGRYFNFFKKDYLYMDACMSVPCGHYGNLGKEFLTEYYALVKKLFIGRDIILVTGDMRFRNMKYKLLQEVSSSLELLEVPWREAWKSHEDTRRRLLDANKDGSKTVVLSCGPMATVLAYELAPYMRCLDLGHLLVDYNLAMGGPQIGKFWG